MRLERGNEGPRRRYVCRIHPFGHHLKAGEVFLQGFEPTVVVSDSDSDQERLQQAFEQYGATRLLPFS